MARSNEDRHMKILYISTGITNSGGVAKVVSLKANYFTEQLNHEVHIISSNDTSQKTFFNFSPLIKFKFISKKHKIIKLLWFFIELLLYIKKYQPHVIIVTDNGFKGLLVPFFISHKIKSIYEMHATNDNFIYLGSKKNNLFSNRSIAYFLSKYHKIVVLNSHQKFQFILKDKQVIIPNPVVISNEVMTSSGNSMVYKKAIAVGRIVPEKGWDRLLRIWKEVITIHPDYYLEIYGEIDPKYNLNSLIEDLNLKKNVKVLKPVNDLERQYSTSDFLVHPSYYESFSMVILEAMSFGLPIICFDLTTDLVNSDYCLIAKNEQEFAENCIKLIENKEVRVQKGTSAKKASIEYESNVIMKKWEDLLLII
ncbi:glycosyltransferase [Flavobacterium sp. NRK F7]|uniref:glycosyltransferase n=1 Tax=Flavobacterium sp. NRK F7 TaxID=2954930 RepID=UPI002090B585|nr:glycosyltransferase [Flavobacterium sp. NRK F7]MCO6162884.1 glycosyltransferase [Flavobacterium sp. NRK F7]